MVDEKTNKPIPTATVDDLPIINAIIAKGDRAEVGPGPNGTIKISHVKRTIVKSGGSKEAKTECSECKAYSRCLQAARDGKMVKCISFLNMQEKIRAVKEPSES